MRLSLPAAPGRSDRVLLCALVPGPRRLLEDRPGPARAARPVTWARDIDSRLLTGPGPPSWPGGHGQETSAADRRGRPGPAPRLFGSCAPPRDDWPGR